MSHRSIIRVLVGAAVLAAGLAWHTPSAVPTAAQEMQPVEIRFRAMVGDQPFACGQSYAGIGTAETRIAPSDFRFYVSDLALIDAEGKPMPIALEQDGRWQYGTVALLDFEDKRGPCSNGTAEIRDVVAGLAPAGAYTGLRFALGVPFELNHQDATIAPSPLNLTSMFWTWQAGYKHFRVDLEPDRSAMTGPMAKPQGAPAGLHGAGDGGAAWAIHLGSTACAAPSRSQAPADCANPNRATVELGGFDPATNEVVADLKGLLDGTNVEANQPETELGCMSNPVDGDCTAIMANFGLPFNDAPSPGQTLFRVR